MGQNARFNDDFHHFALAGFARGAQQSGCRFFVAVHERLVGQDDVDFVRTVGYRVFRFGDGRVNVRSAVRKIHDGRNADARSFQFLFGGFDKAGPHANGGGFAEFTVGFGAQGDDFFIGVVVVQAGQIHGRRTGFRKRWTCRRRPRPECGTF